jgi:hypothetical protein
MNIIKPETWFHTFDIWGVLLDNVRASRGELVLYEEFAGRQRVPVEQVRQNLDMYREAMSGRVSGSEKARLLVPINSFVNTQFRKNPEFRQRSLTDMKECFYDDTIKTMEEILHSGEGIALFTSAVSESVNAALKEKNPYLSETIGAPHAWGKDVEGFRRLEEAIRERASSFNIRLATHTEDEQKYVEEALKSGVYQRGVVFADRKEVIPIELYPDMGARGITVARDLRTIDYKTLARKN